MCTGEWKGGQHPVAGQIRDHGGLFFCFAIFAHMATGDFRSVESKSASVADHLLFGVVNL